MPTRLKHWLTENALTGHQLAQRADVSPRAVYNLIDGRGDRFSRAILSKVAGATNLTREQLLEEPPIASLCLAERNPELTLIGACHQ